MYANSVSPSFSPSPLRPCFWRAKVDPLARQQSGRRGRRNVEGRGGGGEERKGVRGEEGREEGERGIGEERRGRGEEGREEGNRRGEEGR